MHAWKWIYLLSKEGWDGWEKKMNRMDTLLLLMEYGGCVHCFSLCLSVMEFSFCVCVLVVVLFV